MSDKKIGASRRTILTGIWAAALLPLVGGVAKARERSREVGTVEQAVAALRDAMMAGDEARLGALVYDQLSYGHSDGHLDSKASFIRSLAGGKAFQTLSFSDQTVEIVGNTAIVRHIFDALNNLPDGQTSTAHIKVLQVWKQENGRWRLLARQSCPLKA